jgi:hypothetical protein
MRVADNVCQYEYYQGEEYGWLQCNKPAEHVHHIIPEGWQLAHGEEPEHSTGIPLCSNHHVRNANDEEWNYASSFHPDMAWAYRQYPEWKRQAQHAKENGWIKPPSPFEEMVQAHRETIKEGQRYWAFTPDVDMYYLEKMENMAWQYGLEHPDDPRPDTSPHPRYKGPER